MVVRLHVWGPAFGLASIDAECLAAIAFLAQSLAPADYQLVQSSPSAVPTQHLPALHDPSTGAWTSGFTAIASQLRTRPPRPTQPTPTSHAEVLPQTPIQTTTTTTTDPTRTAEADKTAYTAFLTAHAAPLVALSLYVSSANYAAATRPAYSAVLPFPLPWVEPPAARAAMARRAEHLGMSSLDTDADADAGAGGTALGRKTGTMGDAAGWLGAGVSGPAMLKTRGGGGGAGVGAGVGAALTPEHRARIRLEEMAAEVLDVLGAVDWAAQMPEARCLAFGYLALMAVPEVPRPWLREVLEGRYRGLCDFVARFRAEVFPAGGEALPWAEDGTATSAVAVGARLARGVLCEVPGVGELWSRWWTARKKRQVMASRGVETATSGGGLLLLLRAGLGVGAVGAGVWFYRGLPPFGAAVQVWRRPAVALSSFGAAGAMLSGALYGLH